jgi:Tol biopolymer transport system component
LWAIDANGGTAHQLADRFGAAPDLSPDDERVVFRSVSQADRLRSVLVTCHLPACTDMSDVPVDSTVHRWTPDGRDIAYVDRAAPYNITIRSADGKTRQLTSFPDDAEITSFAWSSDGKKLAVARVFTSSDIVMFTGLRP